MVIVQVYKLMSNTPDTHLERHPIFEGGVSFTTFFFKRRV